jgi:transcriptional regulator GlxA family with amidase domain
VLEADGAADVVGIRFRPHGAFALLGVGQDQLADEIVDAGALGLGGLDASLRRAREAATAAEALAHLESVLLERLHGRRADPRLAAVVRGIEATAGTARVEEAARAAGIGRRHLERLFREQVGIGPKVLARLLRFQSAAARVLADPGAPLAAVSGDSGYFDQSHMIREFVAFAGASPDQMRRRLGGLTASMLRTD